MRPSNLAAAGMAVALCLAASPAMASPYDIGSPSVSGDTKLKFTMEQKDSAAKTTAVLPKFALALPLAKDLEIEVGTSRLLIEKPGAVDQQGLGDLEVKAKWVFQHEDGAVPAMALEPKLFLPTGDHGRGLGGGDAQIDLPVLIARNWGKAGLTAKLGYKHDFAGKGGDSKFTTGMLATYKPVPTLRLGIDLIAETPRDDSDKYKLFTDIGANWKATDGIEVQVLAGRSLRTPDHNPATRAKMVVEFKI